MHQFTCDSESGAGIIIIKNALIIVTLNIKNIAEAVCKVTCVWVRLSVSCYS